MRIRCLKNCAAELYPDPISNDGAYRLFEKRRHNKNKNNNKNNNNKMGSDMRSVFSLHKKQIRGEVHIMLRII